MGGLSGVVKAVGLSGGIGDVLGAGSLGMMGISTAASMGDAIYSAYAQKKADKKAYERQISLMDMQNAYNTPAAQMQRYIDAGLNPNLIYSQSNLSASPSAVAHGSSQPRSNIAGSIMSGMSLAQRKEAMQLQHRYDVLKMSQDLQLGQQQIEQVKLANGLAYARLLMEGDKASYLKKMGLTGAEPSWYKSLVQLFGIGKNAGASLADFDYKRGAYNIPIETDLE